MIHAFLNGLVLAIGLIIPLGVQNILVFNQGAMQKPFFRALPVIVTASLCDTFLIVIAVSGLSLVVLKLFWLKNLIYALGFCFLIYMGYTTWKSAISNVDIQQTPLSVKKQVLFSVSVSLLNPHAILDTVGVIGTSSLRFNGTSKLAFTLACILVSWIWFFGLATAGHFMHRLDGSKIALKLINKLSALIIWTMALYMGWHLIQASYAPDAMNLPLMSMH